MIADDHHHGDRNDDDDVVVVLRAENDAVSVLHSQC